MVTPGPIWPSPWTQWCDELAETEADGRQPDLEAVAASLSHGSLIGARGQFRA